MFIAFSAYAADFSKSLMNISKLNSTVQTALVSIGRIFELNDNLTYNTENFGKEQIPAIQGEIKFENISFSYNNEIEVLRNITITIPPNRKVAMVGKSGVGKSTIFNILLRFYEPTKGNILIDGIKIENFDEDSLRKHISVVRQEPFLFNITIRENLLLSNQEATDDDVIAACKAAYIHDYIIKLPWATTLWWVKGASTFLVGKASGLQLPGLY
ncbi:MAG: ATP-binding cassette domain-containing protein [Bacteroidales bacterium]|nr:ATP-binding cassette domain-containing protein [Bacteroidales bacterium]